MTELGAAEGSRSGGREAPGVRGGDRAPVERGAGLFSEALVLAGPGGGAGGASGNELPGDGHSAEVRTVLVDPLGFDAVRRLADLEREIAAVSSPAASADRIDAPDGRERQNEPISRTPEGGPAPAFEPGVDGRDTPGEADLDALAAGGGTSPSEVAATPKEGAAASRPGRAEPPGAGARSSAGERGSGTGSADGEVPRSSEVSARQRRGDAARVGQEADGRSRESAGANADGRARAARSGERADRGDRGARGDSPRVSREAAATAERAPAPGRGAAAAGGVGGESSGSAERGGEAVRGLGSMAEAARSRGGAPAGETPGSSRGLRSEASEQAVKQASRGLAKLVSRGGGEMRLTLQPASLGEVRVAVRVGDGVVSARFEATGEAAREALGTRLAELRGVLESRGVAVERLHVEGFEPRAADTARMPQTAQGRAWEPTGGRDGGPSDHAAGDGSSGGRSDGEPEPGGRGERGARGGGPAGEEPPDGEGGPDDASGVPATEAPDAGDARETVVRLNTVA